MPARRDEASTAQLTTGGVLFSVDSTVYAQLKGILMKLDKHEVRQRDTFLQISDKVSGWISHNRKMVISAGAAIVVAFAAWGAYDLYQNQRETEAQEALYSARKLYNPAIANPFSQKEPKEPKLTGEAIKAFDVVLRNYKNTQASKVAAIELSQAYLQEKKPDSALKIFDQLSTNKASDLVGTLLILQKAKVLEANAKCGDAVTILEKVWSSNSVLKALQTEARLRAGICYEQMSQLDKAKEMFKIAGQDKGAAADTAKKYLRLIEPHAG